MRLLLKKVIGTICLILFVSIYIIAQTKGYPNQILPYNFNLSQELNALIANDTSNNFHNSIKPYFIDDSVFTPTSFFKGYLKSKSSEKSWIKRKLFDEHLLEIENKEYTFYADFLGDFVIGKDSEIGNSTWINTRGYQFGGTIGNKFSFYTSGYENQGKFPSYLDKFINSNNLIPGQAYDRSFGKPTKDWSYATALLSYTPSRYINLVLGHDKNFIGEGYRSMLLSDVSGPYTFFKATATIGKVKYIALYAAMLEPRALRFSYDAGIRKKGGVFHYLDWNVTKKLSLGFFDAVIYSQADDNGNIRGFEWSYINPLIFLRPLEASSGSPDNALIGFTGNYKIFNNLSFYSQFALDEFEAKSFFKKTGSNRNKWGTQLGLKGSNKFVNSTLTYFVEYNLSRPYTYSSRNLIISYSNYSQPLAHPFGANFREAVLGSSFKVSRFLFNAKVNIAKYGLDLNNLNYGKDIFKPYNTSVSSEGNFIGNGLKTNFLYFDGNVSYIINPKTNFRFEIGGVYRKESNTAFTNQTTWLNIGLRSTFRQFYYDF
jgi:prepilin-type processing-associated H-X9-DG protein